MIRFKTHRAGSVQSKLSIMMLLIANATMYIVTFLQKTKVSLSIFNELTLEFNLKTALSAIVCFRQRSETFAGLFRYYMVGWLEEKKIYGLL